MFLVKVPVLKPHVGQAGAGGPQTWPVSWALGEAEATLGSISCWPGCRRTHVSLGCVDRHVGGGGGGHSALLTQFGVCVLSKRKGKLHDWWIPGKLGRDWRHISEKYIYVIFRESSTWFVPVKFSPMSLWVDCKQSSKVSRGMWFGTSRRMLLYK